MQCSDFREVADSYLSDELLVETNHDVIVHLESCSRCRRELAARRALRSTLRRAFAETSELNIADAFVSRLQGDLRAVGPSTAFSMNWRHSQWLIAAVLLVAMTFGAIAVWQRQRMSGGQDHSALTGNLASESSRVTPSVAVPKSDNRAILARISELAAGDHRDCAIGHRLPDMPIDLEEAARRYDLAYAKLTKAVLSHSAQLNDSLELVMAHACFFKGHWFAHVVVRHRDHLVSLLVTKLEEAAGNVEKASDAQIDVVACSSIAEYRISCFRTERHAVFVVSDLDEGENLALTRRLAPAVYEHILRAEHVT